MRRVLVINGPNLNLLGQREPEVYGDTTLQALESMITREGAGLGLEVTTFQSNHEGAIIDAIHGARGEQDGIVINPGAYSHYSYAIHDALLAAELPAVEVHISNIHAREPWRRTSVTAPAAVYAIFGRGVPGYRDALRKLVAHSRRPPQTIAYGESADQVADLLLPDGGGPHAVVVLIHGGYWRDQWTRDLMDGLALDLADHGLASWNIEYRRVGNGGGWPVTFEDVAAAIDALADVEAPIDVDRVAFVGHSAGGQLALWAAKRSRLYSEQPAKRPLVAPRVVVGLAPITDLVDGHRRNLSGGAVAALLRRSPEDGEERYAAASPAALLPLGVTQVVIHGTSDDAVPVDMSRGYAAAAKASGDEVVYHELEGTDHMSLIDPASEAWALALPALRRM